MSRIFGEMRRGAKLRPVVCGPSGRRLSLFRETRAQVLRPLSLLLHCCYRTVAATDVLLHSYCPHSYSKDVAIHARASTSTTKVSDVCPFSLFSSDAIVHLSIHQGCFLLGFIYRAVRM
jgi:hypothetical protein